jgi:hypothetical protein
MLPEELTKQWHSLQSDLESKGAPGFTARAVKLRPGDELDLVAVNSDGKTRVGISFVVSKLSDKEKSSIPICKHLDIFASKEKGAAASRIFHLLDDKRFSSQFTFLTAELLEGLRARESGDKLFAVFVSHVTTWKAFLENAEPEGLSGERQRGLYGELKFILDFSKSVEINKLINFWRGADKKSKDFIFGSVAAEIKTSLTKKHVKIPISNEQQLDTTGLNALMLCVYLMQEEGSNRLSLPDLVQEIRSKIKSNANLTTIFERKLFDYGYSDFQSGSYTAKYQVIGRTLFDVRDDFPRLTNSDIPEGVGDVTYTILTAACQSYICDETHASARIKNAA